MMITVEIEGDWNLMFAMGREFYLAIPANPAQIGRFSGIWMTKWFAEVRAGVPGDDCGISRGRT